MKTPIKSNNNSKRTMKLLIGAIIFGIAVLAVIFLIPFSHNSAAISSSSSTASSNTNNKDSHENEVIDPALEQKQSKFDFKRKQDDKNSNDDGEEEPIKITTSAEPTNNPLLNNKKVEDDQTDLPPVIRESDGENKIFTPSPPKDDLPLILNTNKEIDIDSFIKQNSDLVDETHATILRNVYKLWKQSFVDFSKKPSEENLLDTLVPGMVIPTFHDGDHLQRLLTNFDAPFRHITFINNAPGENGDPIVKRIMDVLKPLRDAGAISAYWRPENAGFSTSINIGLRRVRRVLTETRKKAPSTWNFNVLPIWYFIVNCDSVFKPNSARVFARSTNNQLTMTEEVRFSEYRAKHPGNELRPKKPGLFYTNAIVDHFCFAISEEAVQKAGDMDECFYPAYMEDVDWRWRVHLAGFDDHLTGASVGHHRSVNLKKAKANSPFLKMLERTGRGWEYGRMKWGNIQAGRLRASEPPSGRKTPFGIKGAPLGLYKIDPIHRRCVEEGVGPRFIDSKACWYNGTVLLPYLPKGTQLPWYLTHRVQSMDAYYKEEMRAHRRF